MPKIRTLERKRFSILTNDLNHCYICKKPKQHLHEIFYGRNRKNSMIYGCVIPVCLMCHNKIHHIPEIDKQVKKECNKQFNITYPDLDFIDIFHKKYL